MRCDPCIIYKCVQVVYSSILTIITVIDYIQSVVGDVIPGTDSVKLQIQRPEIRVRDPQTDEIIDSVHSDVPDLLSLHGR